MRKITYIFLCVGSLLFQSCSKYKLNLPVREIDRPLSLPLKTWGVGYGLTPTINEISGVWKPTVSMLEGIRIHFPYLVLNQYLEIHFATVIPYLKYVVVRSTEVQDSIIYLNGLDLSVDATVYPVLADIGIYLEAILGYELKYPLSEKTWITHQAQVLGTYNRDYIASASFGMGRQVNESFSMELRPRYIYYDKGTTADTVYLSSVGGRVDSLGIVEHTLRGLALLIPIEAKYNLNNRFSIALNGGIRYNSRESDGWQLFTITWRKELDGLVPSKNLGKLNYFSFPIGVRAFVTF